MTAIILTEASSGAPTLNGVNGSVTSIMRWGLAQKSWAEEYGGGAGNVAVFRAATGNRFRVQVRHDSAVSGSAQRCIIRGAESASAATTLVDPFPLVAQVAETSCNLLASTTADATARNYYLIVDDTWFVFLTQSGGTTWSIAAFGDAPGAAPDDLWATFILQRNSAAVSVSAPTNPATTNSGVSTIHWARDISGATKSTLGSLYGQGSWGNVSQSAAARGGFANKVLREKVGITCGGSATATPNAMAISRRGWLPHLWNPLHLGIGTLVEGDTMTDTAYNASAEFRVANQAASQWMLIETTPTWAAPGG